MCLTSCARHGPVVRADRASWSLTTPASSTPGRCAKARRELAERGLWLWYLPAYSPELNDIERTFRTLKHETHAPTHLHGHPDADGGRGDRRQAGQRTAETFRLSPEKCIGPYAGEVGHSGRQQELGLGLEASPIARLAQVQLHQTMFGHLAPGPIGCMRGAGLEGSGLLQLPFLGMQPDGATASRCGLHVLRSQGTSVTTPHQVTDLRHASGGEGLAWRTACKKVHVFYSPIVQDGRRESWRSLWRQCSSQTWTKPNTTMVIHSVVACYRR